MGVVRWVCGCGFEELWVWGDAFEEVGMGRWVWGGVCGEVGAGRWVWVGVGVGRWMWCGCGHGESNSCTKLYILRARLYHFIFVQSVIFCQSLCGLLNKLEGVGKCVWWVWVWL